MAPSTITLLSVEPKHLRSLDAGAGVRLIRDLLWCEATRIGIPSEEAGQSPTMALADFIPKGSGLVVALHRVPERAN